MIPAAIDAEMTFGTRFWFPAFVAIVVRPSLWATAVRQLLRTASPGWWRRMPFLPIPNRDYVRFRLETAYGSSGPHAPPVAADLVAYLRWCRDDARMRRVRRRGS